MKSILAKTVLVLGLGTAPCIALAQDEVIKKKPGQQTEQQIQAPSAEPKPDASMDTQAGSGALKKPPEDKAQAPAGEIVEEQAESNQAKQKLPKQGEAQAPAEQAAPSGSTAGQTSDEPKAEGTADTKQPAPADDTADTQSQPSNETTASINVTAEQKTEIRQIITEAKVEPVRDIDVDISVGVAVPRTIEVHPLPPRIVKLVPAYEGYRFFLLADGRIVIVEPDTYKIVVILV